MFSSEYTQITLCPVLTLRFYRVIFRAVTSIKRVSKVLVGSVTIHFSVSTVGELDVHDYVLKHIKAIIHSCLSKGVGTISRVGGHICRSRERETPWGSGGFAPSGVQGQSRWSGVLGGRSPLKLRAF